ncbi:MAG: amidohydrolase family protein [Acidobacteria bacterium]|nr:amidohydrolase family protein [Acidobacteriota bacterium]
MVAEQGYADLLLVNGKIATMDDRGTVPETPGHIFQAMAIKGKRIMALGTNDEMKLLGGPKAQVIDLGGKTVIPGLIQPHFHVRGEASSQFGPKVGLVDPSVNLQVVAETTAEGTAKKVRDTIVNAIEVRKIPKGQWITVNIRENKQNLSGTVGTWFWLFKINRRQFDAATPDHPVKLSGGYTGMFNSVAIREFTKLFPDWEQSADWENGPGAAAAGVAAVPDSTSLSFELWWKNVPITAYAEMYRLHGEQVVIPSGVTSIATVEFSPRNIAAFHLLNREGKMPYRLAYFIQAHRGLHFNQKSMTEFVQGQGAPWFRHSTGSEMLWLNGFGNEMWDGSDNSVCMGPDVPAPPEIKEREKCPVPGTKSFDSYKWAVINGWRPAQSHNTGSHGSRLFIQMLEEAMKEGNYSLDYMRSLRPTVEHCQVIGTPPDVIAGFKKFGVIIDVTPNRLNEIPSLIKAYGEKIRPFAMPVKSYINLGLRVTMEGDGADIWTPLWRLVTRQAADKNTGEKFVLVPEEAIDRVTALKMSTTWASEYLMAEDTIGTLESGKYADFTVLDRDFFTIPVDDILKIKSVMTGLNGKIVYDATPKIAKAE